MKIGDLVRFKITPYDTPKALVNRLWGIVIDDKPYPPAGFLDIKVRVLWQNTNISLIRRARLEVINDQVS